MSKVLLNEMLSRAEVSGQSEAKVVAELVRDIRTDEGDNFDLIVSALDELVSWAKTFLRATLASKQAAAKKGG